MSRTVGWPPIGDEDHTATSGIPRTLSMHSCSCEVTVLVNDVLLASVSKMSIHSPFVRRQSRMAYAARLTTEAKRIGKTVGPYPVLVQHQKAGVGWDTYLVAFNNVFVRRRYCAVGA